MLRFEGDTATGDLDGEDLTHRYLWGTQVDQLLAEEQVHYDDIAEDYVTDHVYWPLADHLGTVRDVAEYDWGPQTTSVVQEYHDYDAFGNLLTPPAAGDVLFLYTGRPLDTDTGLQNNLNRWYDASVGRWLSEDPIGFEAGDENLYRYVENDVTSAVDPLGLWKGRDHKSLTSLAFARAIRPMRHSTTCLEEVLESLKKYNLQQDEGSNYSDFARHYNRKPSEHYVTANKAYRAYTDAERQRFDSALEASPAECEKALKSLGLLSHSWQDYFAHAVLQNGKAGPAWSATTPIKGNPESLNKKLKASSYTAWYATGEHGVKEPAYRDGKVGAQRRKDDAVHYVAKQFRTMLATWFSKCKCYCSANQGGTAARKPVT